MDRRTPHTRFPSLRTKLKSEKTVIAAILLAIVSLFGFIELADEIVESETQSVDVRIATWIHRGNNASDPIGPPWLLNAATDLTALGGTAVLTLAVLVVAGYLALLRDYRSMAFVVIATLLGLAISNTLKLVFARQRPEESLHLVEVSSASFPSGHATLSAVVYLTLGAILASRRQRTRERIFILSVAILATGIIGLTRIYLGVHYPTDVLAGWSLGLSWTLICLLVAGRLNARRVSH